MNLKRIIVVAKNRFTSRFVTLPGTILYVKIGARTSLLLSIHVKQRQSSSIVERGATPTQCTDSVTCS